MTKKPTRSSNKQRVTLNLQTRLREGFGSCSPEESNGRASSVSSLLSREEEEREEKSERSTARILLRLIPGAEDQRECDSSSPREASTANADLSKPSVSSFSSGERGLFVSWNCLWLGSLEGAKVLLLVLLSLDRGDRRQGIPGHDIVVVLIWKNALSQRLFNMRVCLVKRKDGSLAVFMVPSLVRGRKRQYGVPLE